MMSDLQKKSYIESAVLDFFNGDQERADIWFDTPNPGLGDAKPKESSIDGLYKFVKEVMGVEAKAECFGCA